MKSIKAIAGMVALLATSAVNAQSLSVRAPAAPTVDAMTLVGRNNAIVRESGLPSAEQTRLARALEAKTNELLSRGGMTPQGIEAELAKVRSEVLGDKASAVESSIIKAGVLSFSPLSAYTVEKSADAKVAQCELRGKSVSAASSVVDTASGIVNAQQLAAQTDALMAQVAETSKNMGPCTLGAGSSACKAFTKSRQELIRAAADGDIQLLQGFGVMDGIIAKHAGLGIYDATRETAKEVCTIVSGKACGAEESKEYERCIL